MKKNIFLFVFATVLSTPGLSQGWRIAPTFGLNVSYISYSAAFRDNLNPNGLSTKPGALVRAQVGALLDYAVSDRFSIRSGLIYTGKGGSLRFDASQYGIVESIRGGYQFGYVDVPLLLNFAVGRKNWHVIVGGVAGITMSAKGIVEGGNFTGYGYYRGNTSILGIGNRPSQVQPFDFCTTIGYVKEIEVADRPLEVGVYFQHSLTKWNSASRTEPSFYARNHLAGLRVAYLFELRR